MVSPCRKWVHNLRPAGVLCLTSLTVLSTITPNSRLRAESLAMAGTPQGNSRVVLRVAFKGIEEGHSFLEIDAWMPSEVHAISPLVDWLMRQIEGSRCVAGHEPAVELALQEALSNAVVHGNRMDRDKVVHIRCRCEVGKGTSVVVSDQGQGFDLKAVPDPLAVESLNAEHGRGIQLMKLAMDEVSFERGGTEVRMWKSPAKKRDRLEPL